MVYHTSPELVLNNLIVFPRDGADPIEQLTDCYKQITESLKKRNLSKSCIIKQTIFISSQNNADYSQKKQILLSCATGFFKIAPPTSIISQNPENRMLALEILLIEGLIAEEITYHQNENTSWLVFNRCDVKMLVATSSSATPEKAEVLEQSNSTFKHLENILSENNMEFSDIIRQWNYIEQITQNSTINNSESQHYQIFNDVRSKYYNRSVFSNGYPAATGIGQDFGGVILDVIAVKTGEGSSLLSLKSPVQLDAYSYSKEVLAANTVMNDFCRTSPKFERAKILLTPENNCIFVSGTAAIKGQISIPVVSAEEQTEMTIKNILSLISPENLEKAGVVINSVALMDHLRVYVKFSDDLQKVKSVCMKYFPEVPVIYLFADICRPELLVEIEGQALINLA